MKRYFTVIAYDITSDKARDKVAKLLLNYGQRVNYSVFECAITAKQQALLVAKLQGLIEPKTDCVLFYRVCQACFPHSLRIGKDYRASPPSGTVLSV